MTAAAAQKPKLRRRPRLLALWSAGLVESARKRGLSLHKDRPRVTWETEPDGFLELRATVRGAGCAACGRKLAPGTLALYGHSGDSGRTPHARYLCLEKCTGIRPQPVPVVGFAAKEPPTPASLAQLGLFRPDALKPEEIRQVCELALLESRKAGRGSAA